MAQNRFFGIRDLTTHAIEISRTFSTSSSARLVDMPKPRQAKIDSVSRKRSPRASNTQRHTHQRALPERYVFGHDARAGDPKSQPKNLKRSAGAWRTAL